MAFRHCELGLLVRLQPDQARKRILAGFRKQRGHLANTAEDLAVHPATLKRWMHALALHGDVEAIRQKAKKAA